jgi:iron complex outermembrane receptor protein
MNTKLHSTKVFNFRHWTRKSYAVFQSLKLQIRIATIAVGIILVPSLQEAVAQKKLRHESLEEYDLDTMEVLGELTPQLAKELSRNVQIVSVPAQSNLPIPNLQSSVNSISQIDIRQRGPNDIQSDVSINASSFDQVQILLNGFDMTDPQTGHHSFNLPITFNQLQQIQLLSGSGTRMLGVNSFAGTINFVTKKPKKNTLELDVNAGQFGLIDVGASLGLHKNNLSNFVSANRTSSSGYISNTDFIKYSLFYNGSLKIKHSNLEWQLAYMDKAFGANDFYTPKYPNQFEQLNTAIASLRFTNNAKVSTSYSVNYRANADRFELFRGGVDAPKWYSGHNYHFSQLLQLNAKAWTWSKLGKTVLSANYKMESILSNVLGIQMTEQMPAFFSEDGYYDKSDNRSYFNISMEQIYFWKDFKFAAGFMYNKFLAKESSNNKLYPGLDISYKINHKTKIFGGVNTGMRLPTFTDLYYSGPSNIGNANLLPESQTSYQLGVKYDTKLFSIYANTFVNDANNSIDWVRMSDTVKWQPINITDVVSKGFTMGASLHPTYSNNSYLNWINRASMDFTYNTKTSSSGVYQSHYVMDYLKYKLVMSLNHKLYRGFSLGYIMTYQDRVGQYLDYDANSKMSTPQDYKPFTLFDIKLNWDYKSWKLYLSATNVFDVKYQDYGNVQQAGRWITFGVNKKFSL